MKNIFFDPAISFAQKQPSQLDPIFNPKVVAVIGATETEGSVGKTVMQNLISGDFQGKIIPINPRRPTILGLQAYQNVTEVPSSIDLAIIVTPSHTVPSIIESCIAKKIPAAVIISAGFKEIGPEGLALETQIRSLAKDKIRIIGPNCLGIMNPLIGLNATFAADIAKKGNLAFISQSGALCTAVLDWSLQENIGFSGFISIGSMLDVNFGDLIDYFGNDPSTHSILIYMENWGDAGSFLSAAREVSLSKPIILIKAGRSEESAKAAASHTGALSGSDDAFSAALQRVGVLRVDTIADLFAMAAMLSKQEKPKGPNLSIITNAGGPGVIATDALIQHKGSLAKLDKQSMASYNQFLPGPWSHSNPIDILGDASPERYAKTLEIALQDSASDGILVILTPQDMTDPTETARALVPFAKGEKPILASWMGGKRVEEGREILIKAGIPTFDYPDIACQTFASIWNYASHLKSLYEIPSSSDMQIDRQKAEKIIETAKKENRTLLDEYESKQILEAYEIPTVPTKIAKTAKEAVEQAQKMGFPLVLKLYSKTITHKSDVGGVKLNLTDIQAVEKAFEEIYTAVKEKEGEGHFDGVTVQPMIKLDGYELILGSSHDPELGAVLLFGSGGQLVEVYQDRALGLPPLTTTLARKMIQETKVYHALQGVRGKKAVDLKKLEKILVQFSRLITEQKWISECDINPLLVSHDQFIALDARIVLHDPKTKEDALPKPAIRPFPLQYVEKYQLTKQTEILLRPICPEDEPLMVSFHQGLSEESVQHRYLESIQLQDRIVHERLQQMCFIDYAREMAIIAIKDQDILGVVRLSKIPGTKTGVLTLIIQDAWQNQGLGSKLLEKIIQIAKEENLQKIEARMLDKNKPMQKLFQQFKFSMTPEEGLIKAWIQLEL